MIAVSLGERQALDELEPVWRRQGYTLVREPSEEKLPGFLKGFRPDAIAIGAKPSLVIEVMRSRSLSADTKVRNLKRLFEGHDDWRLEVVYMTPYGLPVQSVSKDEIEAALRQIGGLTRRDPRAALLMAWATLEAAARMQQPDLAERTLSPGSLTDLLISLGHLPYGDSEKLRRIGAVRNLLAHGQINVETSEDDVSYLMDATNALLHPAANAET